MARPFTLDWPSAGLFLGPGAWAVNTQLNYALVPQICAGAPHIVLPISIAMLLVSLGAGLVSFRAFWKSPSEPGLDDTRAALPGRFLAGMGMAMGALFAAVIATQGAASLLIDACAR